MENEAPHLIARQTGNDVLPDASKNTTMTSPLASEPNKSTAGISPNATPRKYQNLTKSTKSWKFTSTGLESNNNNNKKSPKKRLPTQLIKRNPSLGYLEEEQLVSMTLKNPNPFNNESDKEE